MIRESDLDPMIVKCLHTLKPYLDQLVVAGGWVPYLYSKMYEDALRSNPLITRDFDAAIPAHGFSDKLPKLDEVVLAAGFEHVFASLENPPVIKYQQPESEGGAEIEFITDAAGDTEGPIKIGSINAQQLHFVSLLMDSPWTVCIETNNEKKTISARVPNPAAFLFHKTLVAPRRRLREKTAKDFYYIFFVLDSFPRWREPIRAGLAAYALRKPAWMRRARRILDARFADADGIGVDLLLSQRPQTEFSSMSDDIFRQYSYHTMADFRSMLS